VLPIKFILNGMVRLRLIEGSMKSKFLFIIFITLSYSSFSQTTKDRSDIGFQFGASSYMGDLNPNTLFKSPQPAFGINYRYNFNPRYLLKFTGVFMGFSANNAAIPPTYNLSSPSSFSSNLIDLAAQFEINFLPFTFADRKIGFTPFISAGIGYYCVILGEGPSLPSLPFALGVKWNFKKRWTIGAEWEHRKLFNDKFDGIENPLPKGESRSLLINNDWYSYLGIFLSYKFLYSGSCPANQNLK